MAVLKSVTITRAALKKQAWSTMKKETQEHPPAKVSPHLAAVLRTVITK